LLYEWIKNDFIPACQYQRRREEDKEKPILVFCDGHSSRFCPDIWELLKNNNIMMYCMPSHSSHIFQVLDLMPNAAIKRLIQTIRPMKKNCSEKEIIKFVRQIEGAVSVALKKDVIEEGLFVI
jgi:hypothetical protein